MIIFPIANAKASSPPGFTLIYLSAIFAVEVKIGSITMTLLPLALAFFILCIVCMVVLAGFFPHTNIFLLCIRSSNELLTTSPKTCFCACIPALQQGPPFAFDAPP